MLYKHFHKGKPFRLHTDTQVLTGQGVELDHRGGNPQTFYGNLDSSRLLVKNQSKHRYQRSLLPHGVIDVLNTDMKDFSFLRDTKDSSIMSSENGESSSVCNDNSSFMCNRSSNFSSSDISDIPMCVKTTDKNVLVKMQTTDSDERDSLVKIDIKLSNFHDGSAKGVVKKTDCNSNFRTSVFKSQQRFTSGRSQNVTQPFTHRVTGATKQIGVLFSGDLPRGYIAPNTYLPPDYKADDYLRAVSEITKSNKPNYQECRIAIPSNFNISLWHLVNLLQFGFPLGIKGVSLGHKRPFPFMQSTH